VKMSIPQSGIRYKKSFWLVVNEVWINYIAIFFVSYAVCNFILNHLFENRWLMARKKSFFVKNKEI